MSKIYLLITQGLVDDSGILGFILDMIEPVDIGQRLARRAAVFVKGIGPLPSGMRPAT